MLPNDPGQMATVLVALAATESNPSQMSVGNVSSVPPPATELIAPAAKAEAKAEEPCKRSIEADKIKDYQEPAWPRRRLSLPSIPIVRPHNQWAS